MYFRDNLTGGSTTQPAFFQIFVSRDIPTTKVNMDWGSVVQKD